MSTVEQIRSCHEETARNEWDSESERRVRMVWEEKLNVRVSARKN